MIKISKYIHCTKVIATAQAYPAGHDRRWTMKRLRGAVENLQSMSRSQASPPGTIGGPRSREPRARAEKRESRGQLAPADWLRERTHARTRARAHTHTHTQAHRHTGTQAHTHTHTTRPSREGRYAAGGGRSGILVQIHI